uniref:dynein regulatory complex subunit 3 isoform X2 n=1 Tax=Monopterus albus TaxID=43700 RepID=UPI0009B493C2|nr:dynein regulatory complex subunit 3 isoform X2 [Monopterus albus]
MNWQSEPIVIDKKLLEQAVEHQTGCTAKAKGTHFNEMLYLNLQDKEIVMIDNLWEFKSLAKLNLNNNFIERIWGLDCLVNLTWLDLSFNKIKRIEGLQSLRKLEMLNLSNNRISVIENMDKLEKLTHFSIANNLLGQLDNVLYLRRFKNLFNLTLCGNPATEEDRYIFFIAAYFPDLMCLDYKILNEKIKNEAAIKYKNALEEMRCEEQQKKQADDAEQSQKAELQLHTDAFVEFLNGSYLFKSMFDDDPAAETLQCMPEVADLLQTFEQKMVALCMKLFEVGLAEHKQREMEVTAFFSGHTETVKYYQQKASHILANFEQQHKERLQKLQQLSDPDLLKVEINGGNDENNQLCKSLMSLKFPLISQRLQRLQKLSDPDLLKVEINGGNDEINQLCKSLMSLEFPLISQVEDFIKTLDLSISEMVGNFSETVQGIFAQCRDLEDKYHQSLKKFAVATLEKVATDSLDEEEELDMTDDFIMLFTDRDTVMDVLATGHDNHLMKINDRETLLVTRLNAWKAALIKGIQDKELKLHRIRLSDIHRYADYLRKQLEEMQ